MQEGEINLFSESSQWEHLSGFQMIIGSRSSHHSSSIIKGVFRKFAKFTGKHLWQSLFFNMVAGLRPQDWNFTKKRDSGTGVFL